MRIQSILVAATVVSSLSLAGCATGVPAQISRYQAMPAPQGQSFYVVAANPAQAGTAEFSEYSAMVARAMQAQGYVPAGSPDAATMLVKLNYGVDQGRIVFERSANMAGPYGGYAAYGPYRNPLYVSPLPAAVNDHAPYYYALSDPLYSPYGQTGYARQKVYESYVDLEIRRRADNVGLFGGHAKAQSSSGELERTVPQLVTAMFTGFPGRSGETVQIVVPRQQTN